MEKFKELLENLNACDEAIQWAKDMPIEEVVKKCHRGDWLLWLAKRLDVDFRLLTLAKGKCANTLIHLMRDERSITAVKVAINFGNNKATIEDLHAAAVYAAAAWADAAYNDAAFDDADAAAYAAAYAAAAAYDAAAAASVASVAYDAAAAAAASVAYDAAAAASVAYDVGAAYDAAAAYDDAAIKENQLKTAKISRQILGKIIIEKVNKKLKQ